MSIDVLNESGTDHDEAALSRLARFVLEAMRIHPQAELCVKLVDEATIATMNERWMDAEGPTDVLAFPMDELRPGHDDDDLPDGVVGDVVLCPQVAAAQAASRGHSVRHETDLLVIHGILHLLGYDHAGPQEEREMFGLQERLLAQWERRPQGEGGRHGAAVYRSGGA
ncbi:MAG: rRNA maturation RNase YbeY [Actinomycetota bacterium]|nr:rRNA maturation RNase YbeY [Actinomycetota bacterium]